MPELDVVLPSGAAHPGALRSQWIPDDPALWRTEAYRDFMEARKELLADSANACLKSLLHGDTAILDGVRPAKIATTPLLGGITSEDEAQELKALNSWVAECGFARGELSFDLLDHESGEQLAMLDLAWPNGVQEELTEPVAVLLDESSDLISLANSAGFRCFTSVTAFKKYVDNLNATSAEVAAE